MKELVYQSKTHCDETGERGSEYSINEIKIKVSTDAWNLFYHTNNIYFNSVKYYSDLSWNGQKAMEETGIIVKYRRIFLLDKRLLLKLQLRY